MRERVAAEHEVPRDQGAGLRDQTLEVSPDPRRLQMGQEDAGRGHKPVTPSPLPACSSKFSCSSRCSTRDADLAAGARGPVDVEELGDHVGAGQDDRLARRRPRRRPRASASIGSSLDDVVPSAVAPASRERGEGLRQRVRRLPLALLAHRLDRRPGRAGCVGQVIVSPPTAPIAASMRAAASSTGQQHVVGTYGCRRAPRAASAPGGRRRPSSACSTRRTTL